MLAGCCHDWIQSVEKVLNDIQNGTKGDNFLGPRPFDCGAAVAELTVLFERFELGSDYNKYDINP